MKDKIECLDKGYVRLCDVMGSDLSVVNAARVSYDKESETFSKKDKGLLAFLLREGHTSPFRHAALTYEAYAPLFVARQWWKYCYSSDTEVLTSDGWKFWPDVIEQDELANVTEGGEYYFAKPKELISYHYDGDMVFFRNSKVDLLVTPNHRMRVSTRAGEWHMRRADECLTSDLKLSLLPSRQMSEGEDKDYTLGFWYGFLLAEGNFTATNNRAYIIVKKQREIDALNWLMEGTPWADWREHPESKGCKKFSCAKPDAVCSGSLMNKKFDISWLPQTRRSLEGVLDGFYAGDGSSNQWGTRQVGTINTDVLGGLEDICLQLGIPTSRFTLSKDRNTYANHDMHYLTMMDNKHRWLQRSERGYIQYDGYVYCAEVETGLLLVRRNGKVSVAGNCVASAHVDDQNGWNESSRRYITEDPVFHIPDHDKWRRAPENSKQGSGDNFGEGLGMYWSRRLEDFLKAGETLYERALDAGIAPEQARLFLPAYGMYVRWRWTISLQGMLHFLQQRLAGDAQKEIQVYAQAVHELSEPHFPATFSAWDDHA